MVTSPTPFAFASASRGVESVLAEELRGLGIAPLDVRRGGVAFGTTLEHAYLACLWSRVASRVLLPLAVFDVDDADGLYEGVHAIRWTEHVGAERTLAVAAAGAGSPAGPPNFIVLKTKDAIVDRVRADEGARPSIDKRRPDVRVHVHVRGPKTTVSLDLAGRGLHRRGIGREDAIAPLRETLAAALLRISGWPGRADSAPLCDPMCGSATLLIEAVGIALDVAPGLARDRTGVEGWRGHDPALWDRLRREARERRAAARSRVVRIAGFDVSPSAVASARRRVDIAGAVGRIAIERGELRDAAAPWPDPGDVVTNPPYGARLGEAGELGPLYETLGDTLKRRFPGWRAWVLSGNRALEKRIGLRASLAAELWNGPIPCRLLDIPIGSAPSPARPGPGWRRPSDEARGLARRLRANLRRLGPWARREGLDCYRVYDADIPVYNVAVDRYGDHVRVEEFARPRKVAAEDAERRLSDALQVVSEVLEVDPASIALRVRRRLLPGEQHERFGDRGRFHEVREGDLRFRVNLTDYLDTGLFLDDRLLRGRLRTAARDRDVLNLFAYTCAASVAAAAGGARSVTSVDLSNGYLEWGRANAALNGQDERVHRFLRADALRLLDDSRGARRYGLIFLAPPARSRSASMRDDLDLQRDVARLLAGAARRLAPGGTIVFSSGLRDLEIERAAPAGLDVEEISGSITPLDFARRPRLRAWELRRPD